jgi:hypothetical protein
MPLTAASAKTFWALSIDQHAHMHTTTWATGMVSTIAIRPE